ncbi:hypothetical protein KI387_018547, partial [Taxus chinensis]
NVTKKASGAVILDSGNFLLLGDDNKFEIVWQSFDHPVDFVLRWSNSVQYWESRVWNGKNFGHIPEMLQTNKSLFNISVENSSPVIYVTYTMMATVTALSSFIVDKCGTIRMYNLIDVDEWSMFWSQPVDQCTVYNLCGAYGTCNLKNLQFYSCAEGFKPRDNRAWDLQDWWTSGCVPEIPFNCDGSTDGFNDLRVSLPENQASSYPAQRKKDCVKPCLGNCSCTAFSYEKASGTCRIWFGDLINMQNSPSKSSSQVFSRVATSALDHVCRSSSFKRIKTTIVAGVFATLAVFLGIISIFLMCRRGRLPSTEMVADSSNALLRTFTYKDLKIATRNFKYKLRSGGFGSVFKGTLPDHTLLAVKKLEGSRQGEIQFRAEISSFGNIQHVNLVRLRGFCAEASRSRDSKSIQKVLDWKTRFEIALGTARGLVYLHEKCRDRTIHGDFKPENILVDNDFSPKLADFGLAKVVGRDFSRVLTTTRGTRGYLAPEWIYGLPITVKVDVYSFGMTLFEIISCRRNLELNVEDSRYYFPACAV